MFISIYLIILINNISMTKILINKIKHQIYNNDVSYIFKNDITKIQPRLIIIKPVGERKNQNYS